MAVGRTDHGPDRCRVRHQGSVVRRYPAEGARVAAVDITEQALSGHPGEATLPVVADVATWTGDLWTDETAGMAESALDGTWEALPLQETPEADSDDGVFTLPASRVAPA
ncbi:hypothetical protein ACWCQM_15685 [Streptomyces sp. NPDC002125]